MTGDTMTPELSEADRAAIERICDRSYYSARVNIEAVARHFLAKGMERAAVDTKYLQLLERFSSEQWICMKCGCRWRLNKPANHGKRSWSLFNAEQKSCGVCDNSPEFLNVIVPALTKDFTLGELVEWTDAAAIRAAKGQP